MNQPTSVVTLRSVSPFVFLCLSDCQSASLCFSLPPSLPLSLSLCLFLSHHTFDHSVSLSACSPDSRLPQWSDWISNATPWAGSQRQHPKRPWCSSVALRCQCRSLGARWCPSAPRGADWPGWQVWANSPYDGRCRRPEACCRTTAGHR